MKGAFTNLHPALNSELAAQFLENFGLENCLHDNQNEDHQRKQRACSHVPLRSSDKCYAEGTDWVVSGDFISFFAPSPK
jgi:hypothetical protein